MQGCGKTTIVEVLEAVFKHEGMRPASISIDDFYLRFEDQQALAKVSLIHFALPPAHPSSTPDNLACTLPPQAGASMICEDQYRCDFVLHRCAGLSALQSEMRCCWTEALKRSEDMLAKELLVMRCCATEGL